MRYVCSVCGYVYDEAREKTAFFDLPDSWKCPVCKAAKAAFVPEARRKRLSPAAKPPAAPGMNTVSEEEHFTKLSRRPAGRPVLKSGKGLREAVPRGRSVSVHPPWRSTLPRVRPPDPETSMEALSALMTEDMKKAIPLSVQPPTPLATGGQSGSVYGAKRSQGCCFPCSPSTRARARPF